MGDTIYVGVSADGLARAMIGQGRLDEAAGLIEIARPHLDGGIPIIRASFDLLRGLFEVHRGDADLAGSLIREGLRVADGTVMLNWRARARLDLAEVLRLGGREGEAMPILEEALALFEQKQNLVGVRRAREMLGSL